jgi:hypothetical protein
MWCLMAHTSYFSDFAAIYSLGTAKLCLLCTLKLPSNSTDKHPHFYLIFSYFIAVFFLLEKQCFPYLEMHTEP